LIVRKNGEQLLVISLRSALDRLPGKSKAGTLWEESCHFCSSVLQVDVLAVEVHDWLAMLALNLGGNKAAEFTDVPPRCPLGRLLGAHINSSAF
jgi:hypothetical protein